MTIRLTRPLPCAAVFLLAVLTPATAGVLGSCKPTQLLYYATPLDQSSTTSSTFVTIPQTAIPINLFEFSCVIVRFSAMTYASDGRQVEIRAVLNSRVALPAAVQYSGDDSKANAHSYEFIFGRVEAGSYRLKMQFRSTLGGAVAVHRHTTVVQYNID